MIHHIAIWCSDLDLMSAFYIKYFAATRSALYSNPTNGFKSYFLTFEGGARLELMSRPDIPANLNDREAAQHLGLIHISFALPTKEEVDSKARHLLSDGFPVLRGPRVTGDGYYEFESLDPEGNRIEVMQG